jgi:2,5-furandicarboxylate decarboxylase 1
MGMDATKPLDADEMKFKRIRIPGEDKIDLNKVISTIPSQSWREVLSQ